MTTYNGTQQVDPGLYMNLRKFAITSVEQPEVLPGAATDTPSAHRASGQAPIVVPTTRRRRS